MSPFDQPPPPLTAAQIRTLYEQNPRPQLRAMAWELWRLQRVLVGLAAGLRGAGRLRHRQDVHDHVAQMLAYLEPEPCLNEAQAVQPGHRRGDDQR